MRWKLIGQGSGLALFGAGECLQAFRGRAKKRQGDMARDFRSRGSLCFSWANKSDFVAVRGIQVTGQ